MESLSHACDHDTHVLGVRISVLDMGLAVERLIGWSQEARHRTVFVRDVAALMLAVGDPAYRRAHDRADIVTPDGMPLVWLGRLRGLPISRVCGPDLLPEVCRASLQRGQSHYFYGGPPGAAEALALKFSALFPGLRVAGTFSPPMREIDADFELTEEIRSELDTIRESGADFVWVGLSSPKQDFFIMRAAPYVGRGVFLAVGAAFDFHSGRVKRAPLWMQKSGLEWLSRLIHEPRRLWRRYLVLAPKFVWLVALEGLGWRKA